MTRTVLTVISVICSLLSGITQSLSLASVEQVRTSKASKEVRREIALTFDDLPAAYGGLETMTEVTNAIVRGLKANGIPAIGFVNEGKLHIPGQMEKRVALLRMWVDAGLDLGNHTYSHIAIDFPHSHRPGSALCLQGGRYSRRGGDEKTAP